MGVFTYENEYTSSVSPARLYKALVKDRDILIPEAAEPIQSIEIVEGNGGPGSLKKYTFSEGGETKYVLHKVGAIDEADYGYKYSIVGGSGLPDTVEKISFETKLVEGSNGGSIGKVTVTYVTKTDAPPSDDQLASGKTKGDGLFRSVEAYLLAHPDYN